jgi:hypothetical protein
MGEVLHRFTAYQLHGDNSVLMPDAMRRTTTEEAIDKVLSDHWLAQ